MTATNTNTTINTLAARAAGLLTKASAYAVAEKAMAQALAAKRVFPPMAEDFGQQLGHELPLKTKDFVQVVGHLLQSTDKPLKGVISKRKSEILAVLAELVAALADTHPLQLPKWAIPKERAKKPEAAEAEAVGALDKANTLAEAEAKAAKAEAASDLRLAEAVALIVARAGELSDDQRALLASVIATEEAEAPAPAPAPALAPAAAPAAALAEALALAAALAPAPAAALAEALALADADADAEADADADAEALA